VKRTDNQPKILWTPNKDDIANSNLTTYQKWLKEEKNLHFDSYHELWRWSVSKTEEFWKSIWNFFDIQYSGTFTTVQSPDLMPDTKWFEGARLNYSEHIFRQESNQRPAIIYSSENGQINELSWLELRAQVASLRNKLIEFDIEPGDRVVGWLPNIPEAIVSFLAVNSLGAVWSGTSPDFGIKSVIDRFAQIRPKVMITANGYQYNGRQINKMDDIEIVKQSLPTVNHTILVSFIEQSNASDHTNHIWEDCVSDKVKLEFTRVPFESPIWILYSSGTTGLPKAITHSYGGALLEHLKYLSFHNDVKPGERFFWFTTTGWMMWNYQLASLLCGSTIVLYEGSPGYPSINALWDFASKTRINHFGTSAPFILANMKASTHPAKEFDLTSLRSIGSTGAPLPPDGFNWVYDHISQDIWLASISGGTDVCSAFVGGNPLLPVYSGEIQCIALGCALESYDEKGNSVIDAVGEMIISKPMPSMPVFFWNDTDKIRYKESYFDVFPKVWRHGDWIKITPRWGVVIYGRSDATLNRGGIRIGTSEIYSALDHLQEIKDSLVVCVNKDDGSSYMPLFVVTGSDLTEELKNTIKSTIRQQCTPRHVPDDIIQIEEVPYTISGKKTETPVKKILMGKDLDLSLNKDALKNPKVLDFFIQYYKKGIA